VLARRRLPDRCAYPRQVGRVTHTRCVDLAVVPSMRLGRRAAVKQAQDRKANALLVLQVEQRKFAQSSPIWVTSGIAALPRAGRHKRHGCDGLFCCNPLPGINRVRDVDHKDGAFGV
jgi:hypothetical protein